jgi:hypothetical protein
MLPEGSIGADGAPEDDARLRHGRSDDVRIVTFFRRPLMEEIAVGAPRSQSRFHRRRGDRQVEKAQRTSKVFSFLAIRALAGGTRQIKMRPKSVATRVFGNVFVASASISASE